MIEIRPYEPEMLPGLTEAYNAAVRHVPHSYAVTDRELASGLRGASLERWDGEPAREEAVFVALDAGRALGFIHVGVGARRSEAAGDYGVIRFFCYERGRRDAGQALVEAGEARLREFPIDRISTFDHHEKYPFLQIEASYLSERIDHVHALLGRNGYRAQRGEVILEWPDFDPPEAGEPPIDCETVVARKTGSATLPSLDVRAVQSGRQIGVCAIESVGEYTGAAEAQEWALVAWLGIEDEWQGRGLGRWLLSLGLHEARTLGYRHSVISTDWRNDRAFVFYSNYGYRLSDWTYILSREIDR